jgi:hypothetical protein
MGLQPARRVLWTATATAVAFAVTSAIVRSAAGRDEGDDSSRPQLALKATPNVGFSPVRIRLVADLRGGADDFEEYYCPGVEWDWGDGTVSESSADCEPYEAGKSTIKRRFSIEHVFNTAGNYRVNIRLKRKDKVLTNAITTVSVRPGLAEPY